MAFDMTQLVTNTFNTGPGIFVMVMAIIAILIVIGFVLVGGVLFWFIYLNKKVIIVEDLGTLRLKFDRARLKTEKDGALRLKLFITKQSLIPPESDYWVLKRRTSTLFVLKYADMYVPIKPAILVQNSDGTLHKGAIAFKAEHQRRLIWLNEKKRQKEKFDPKGWWDKYGTAITILGTLAMCFLILIVTYQYQASTAASANAAADRLADALKIIGDIIKAKQSGALG